MDGKALFDEVIAQARQGRHDIPPARVAALFGVSEDTFRRLALHCYPLSLPDAAMQIAARQVAVALEETGQAGFEDALRCLKGDANCLRVVRLLLQTQD